MFKRIDDTTEIDTDFITCAEYQLFLDEMRAQGKYYQPDHWTAYTFFETTPKLSATAPVLGVRVEDAETFVNWLNKREKATYRLPTPTEAKEFPANIGNIATLCLERWHQNNGQYRIISLQGIEKIGQQYLELEKKLSELSSLQLPDNWIALCISNFGMQPMEYFHAHARSYSYSYVYSHFLDIDADIANKISIALTTDDIRKHSINPFDLCLSLASILDNELNIMLQNRKFDSALQQLKQLQTSFSMKKQQVAILLSDLISYQIAATEQIIHRTVRTYAIHLFEYTWIGLNELKKEEIVIRPWWQFWKRPSLKVAKTDYLEKEQNILENYWRLKIVEAREAGELPAWEGIRLVRVTAEK